MRKANRVMYSYLTSLEKGIKELKKEIKDCPKEELEERFLSAMENKHSEKLADRLQKFFNHLRIRNERKCES